jgi:hypothetical protein
MSMLYIAMHDALNAVNNIYIHYAFNSNSPDADPLAAAAQAAHEVAIDQYPYYHQ